MESLTDLLLEMLRIDSTSSREAEMTAWLARHLEAPSLRRHPVGDGTENLLFSWGTPRVVFCTHQDTVPPYIAPQIRTVRRGAAFPDGSVAERDETLVTGRGACDAKGQIAAMYTACKQLEAEGKSGFGLLLLTGEETGSFGAKAWNRDCPGADLLVVGEPTDNVPVAATKGTRSYEVTISGKACHSGYPELGVSAVERFVDFVAALRAAAFPEDPQLGPTTWNIGRLTSPNPQNILSPELGFRLYFRTTFASEQAVPDWMDRLDPAVFSVTDRGGDRPLHYFVPEGFPSRTAAFGSDAPRLEKFPRRILCGPGSITVAHTEREFIRLSDLETAVRNYVRIFNETEDRRCL